MNLSDVCVCVLCVWVYVSVCLYEHFMSGQMSLHFE